MGEGFDFFDHEGVADPDLVAQLSHIQPKVADPDLLARLIDGHCGIDRDFKLFGFAAEKRALRQKLRAKVGSLKDVASEILELRIDGREVDPLLEALHDLSARQGPASKRVEAALQLLNALETIRTWPMSPSGKGGAPENDPAIGRVVEAVAAYCGRQGIAFSGAPRREQADNAPHYFVKSPAAQLTANVLRVLGLSVEPKKLGTFMRKARVSTRA
ncbi:MAG: hypothetical protein M3N07_02300 [Pseudomonadota bacterium]|nr:hypothetical protein [Pseudomonadota bacterium]